MMPEKWNSSALKYEKYAIPKTAKGSTTVSIKLKKKKSLLN